MYELISDIRGSVNHWKYVGKEGSRLLSKQASNPSRLKEGSNIPNKSMSAIASKMEGSNSCHVWVAVCSPFVVIVWSSRAGSQVGTKFGVHDLM